MVMRCAPEFGQAFPAQKSDSETKQTFIESRLACSLHTRKRFRCIKVVCSQEKICRASLLRNLSCVSFTFIIGLQRSILTARRLQPSGRIRHGRRLLRCEALCTVSGAAAISGQFPSAVPVVVIKRVDNPQYRLLTSSSPSRDKRQ